MRTVFDLPENLLEIDIQIFFEYQFPLRYQLPNSLLKNLTGTGYVQLINLQDTMHNSDFDIYRPVTIFHFAQNLAENQYYLEIFSQYQFPLRYQFPPAISEKNQTTTAHIELINFQDPTHKNDFDLIMEGQHLIYQKSYWKPKARCSQNISSLPDVSYIPQPFLKNLRGIVYVQLINIQDIYHTQKGF